MVVYHRIVSWCRWFYLGRTPQIALLVWCCHPLLIKRLSSFWPVNWLTNLYCFLVSIEFSLISVNSECHLLSLSIVLYLFCSLLYESQRSCILYLNPILTLLLSTLLWLLNCLSYNGFCALIFPLWEVVLLHQGCFATDSFVNRLHAQVSLHLGLAGCWTCC